MEFLEQCFQGANLQAKASIFQENCQLLSSDTRQQSVRKTGWNFRPQLKIRQQYLYINYATKENGKTRDKSSYYWLSKYFQDEKKAADDLYTMKCPGKVFTKDDVPRCGNEVFSIFK